MNIKRYCLGSIVVAIYFYLHGYGLHGVGMDFFLPPSESSGFYLWIRMAYLLMAFGFCFIFLKGYENKGIWEGVRFGFYVGLAFSLPQVLLDFAGFPHPADWLVARIISHLIMMILGGVIIAAIYRPK